MANLSELERKELGKLFTAAARIKKLLDANSDSVHDVVNGEITITTDEDEKRTLASFMDFSKGSLADIELIVNSSELLEDHFRPRK